MAKKYSFADHPEHRDALAEHHARWAQVPLDCTPMTDDDRAACAAAVREMYRVANVSGEPRVVFTPSPFAAQIAAGFAAAIWYRQSHRAATEAATDDATFAATLDATLAATIGATLAATLAATYAATDAATFAATDSATRDATFDATFDATRAATRDATLDATFAATRAATRDATLDATFAATDATFVLGCAASVWRLRNGGNMWSGWAEYLAFFRDVAELPIDWAPFGPYETVALKSGPRYVHEKFCIVSDRPEFIRGYWRDKRFVAHCENGPSHRWRDGSCIYTWHGRQIGWRFGARSGGHPDIIDRPESITIDAIRAEQNAEIRRVMIAKYGTARYTRESGARIIHEDAYGKLWSADRAGDTPITMLECRNGTPEPIGYAPTDGESGEWVGNRWHKHYWLRVPPTTRTARQAEAWIHGLERASDYAPEART